jgi:hypothetical protein
VRAGVQVTGGPGGTAGVDVAAGENAGDAEPEQPATTDR